MKAMNLNDIAQDLLKILQKDGSDIVKGYSLNSPRAIGDAIQAFLGSDKGLTAILKKHGIEVKDDFTRRSMEDIAFTDEQGRYYAIDVKTHNLLTNFNMPNLISVKRLAQFYRRSDNNFFCILIVEYKVQDNILHYTKCHFKPIEAFNWDCLTFGALGWGQIQIANANILNFQDEHKTDRNKWMIDMCDKLQEFYDEEIGKITERKSWFAETKKYWSDKK